MTQGKPLFSESHASAQSLKNGWTRMASPWKTMEVILTPDRLTVRPRGLAGWLARLLVLDLHHEIPLGAIGEVREAGEWSGYRKIEVSFRSPDGEKRKLMLYLENGRDFVGAVKGLMSPPAP